VLETLSPPPSAALTRLVDLRHLSAQMAENAGRERALWGAVIASRSKLGVDDIRTESKSRGMVEFAWDAIRMIRQRADTPTKIIDAVAGVESEYFGKYEQIRNTVFADGVTGEYKITGSDYVARATTAINSILHLADEIGKAANEAANDEATRSMRSLMLNAAMLLAGIVLVLISFWIAFRRIVGPLNLMTGTMSKLAGGDKTVEIPARDSKDEIGEMAGAVQVFKDSMIETDRLRAEQEGLKQQAEIDKKTMLNKLADDFDKSVRGSLDTLASAATEMRATSQSMSATAEETSAQATTVAAAAEQASANVQTVATATEELSSSVAEIGRQVSESTKIAGKAVDEASRTNVTVKGLSEAAQKIGDVVKLISDIASQTNLLALNATIEAARAGEAGKGFAVVASEVKSLANQTAKATEEISAQVAAMQSATSEAVQAIQSIGGTIGTINEIATTIASAVEEQGAATQEIARNVQEAAQGTGQVSSNIVGVNQAAAETGAASSQVLASAEELGKQAETLRADVGTFLANIRAA
jgi:methyl-accepting chemotaxis protein